MSGQGGASFNRTMVAGSEEDFDVLCDPCDTEGQRVQATGHCIECNENLCVSCMKVHKKMKVLRGHDVRDKATLSHAQKATIDGSLEEQDPLADKCRKHPEEFIKFYCNSDHTLGCSVCISLNHRSCKDISYIRDISGDDESSDELKTFQTELLMFVANLTSTLHRIEWIKNTLNESYVQVVSDIRRLKKDIMERLDQLQDGILDAASSMKEEMTQRLDGTVSKCVSMIGETEEIIADIEKKKSMNHNNRVFISMKIAQDRLRHLADESNRVRNNNKCERLSFKCDDKLDDLLSTLISLGTVSLVSKSAYVKAKYTYNINVKSDTDTEDCCISGLTVLPDDRLVLTDWYNQTVKLVDVTRCKVSEQIKVVSNPYDLTSIKENKIAVVLNEERYIQVLSVSPVLSKCQTIAVPGHYSGIEHIPDRLILVCRDPIKGVHVCDMSGALLQQIETDYDGKCLFTHPSRIAISPDHGVMYVSDLLGHFVVSLTMDGKLINKYVDAKLIRAIGIAVDDGGCVYACSYEKHSVHMLSPSGHQLRILLDENDKLLFPFAITHSAGKLFINNRYIESKYTNNVFVYCLEE